MPELSLNARVVAGSTFGPPSEASLRYAMVENVPSPEMQAALDELVAAGLLVRDNEPGGAVRYERAPGADFIRFRAEYMTLGFNGELPSIRVFVKKGPSHDE